MSENSQKNMTDTDTTQTTEITRHLLCPHCREPLLRTGGSLCCKNRHTYDLSRTGYVNLVNTSSRRQSGDTTEMAAARTAFLDTGAYAPLRDAVCAAAGSGDLLIDAGCGEGYYTAALAKNYGTVYGFDLSKASVNASAKRARAQGVAHRCFFGVGSVYSLPVPDGSADCVTNVFAPCAEQEYARVLRRGGLLVVACAGTRHLEGLKAVLYDDVRDNTERSDLPVNMEKIAEHKLSYEITLSTPDEIRDLYMMTPYSYRTGIEAQKKLLSLTSLCTLVDFDIHVYRK